MHTAHLSLLAILATVCGALPSPNTGTCREINIPISVAAPRFILNTTIENNWDVASLIFNLTRWDSTSSEDPLPISGTTSTSVENNFTVGATLCGTGETILVLTHGIIESKLYWDPNFAGAERYSFVQAAVAAGYSVLNYDRIGVGSSSNVNALSDAQFQVETAVLNTLTGYARALPYVKQVALVGHSYGAYLSAASASQIDVDALVLTGFSGTFAYFGPFLAGSGLRVAQTQSPRRWGDLDSAYLISADEFDEAYIYFAEPYFERSVAKWAFEVASEPFAVGELPSLMATNIDYSNITSPVYILQGKFDVSACGGNCVGLLDNSTTLFNGSRVVDWVDDLPAGHSLNLHKVGPKAFQMIFDFLHEQDL